MVFDVNSKTLIIYIAIQKQKKIFMHLKKQTQIEIKIQVKALLFNKTLIIVLIKYSDYSNIFLTENLAEFLEHIKINNYVINLKKDKQLFFGSSYSLRLVELKILKTYIEINLANGFI